MIENTIAIITCSYINTLSSGVLNNLCKKSVKKCFLHCLISSTSSGFAKWASPKWYQNTHEQRTCIIVTTDTLIKTNDKNWIRSQAQISVIESIPKILVSDSNLYQK